MKKVFAFIIIMIFNTQLNAKYNNFRFKILNPFRWNYHFSFPKIEHTKTEDYSKYHKLDKDKHELQTKNLNINPCHINICESVDSSATKYGFLS